MNKEPPSPFRVASIAVFTLTCLGLLGFLWKVFGGPLPLDAKGYQVKVAFDDASTLATQSDVRIAGVSVGKVVKKDLAPEGNRTLTTLEIDPEFVPLRSDAQAILRQKTLLGETYVELTTGSKTAPPLKEDDRLPDGRVADAVEFDEFLRVFDRNTQTAFREWQASAAKAGVGRARDLNDGLGNLPVFTENAQSVVDVLGQRSLAVYALVRNAGSTFEAITRNETALSTLIRQNTAVFGELADKRDRLAESIRILPTFQDQTRSTLARLARFSAATEPLVRDLDPVLKDTVPTLDALGRLSPDLRRLFVDFDPLIDASREGLPALTRTLSNLTPTLAATGPFLQQVNPILRFLELNQAKISDFLNIGPNALGGIRSVVPGSKSNGHVLPQIIMAGSESLPAVVRNNANRGNAYLAPQDLLIDPAIRAIGSFDCNRSGEKAPTTTPGCKVSEGLRFQGLQQKFPRIREGGPGGIDPVNP